MREGSADEQPTTDSGTLRQIHTCTVYIRWANPKILTRAHENGFWCALLTWSVFRAKYSGFRDSMVYLGRNRNDLDFYFSDFTMYFMLLGDPELTTFENFESQISNQKKNFQVHLGIS